MFCYVLFFLILGLGAAGESSPREGFVVRVRGETDSSQLDYVSPECFSTCDLDVCHFLLPNQCPNPKIIAGGEKRTASTLGEHRDLAGIERISTDSTYANETELDHLYERVPRNPWTSSYWNVRNSAKYLPGQSLPRKDFPAPDPQYSRFMKYLSDGETEAAMSAFDTFGNQLTQMGSPGLHGCTVVTVVSNRAVWSAHFWETYSNGPGMVEDPKYGQNFQERVIDFILGNPVNNPTNTQITEEEIKALAPPGGWTGNYRPKVNLYVAPKGPSLSGATLAHFTGANDEPTAYIMTPLELRNPNERWSISLKDSLMKEIRYPTRIIRIGKALQHEIPGLVDARGKLKLAVLGYAALDYRDAAEKKQAYKNHRGIALFQRNPNALGTGSPAWRLFYQQFVRTGRA